MKTVDTDLLIPALMIAASKYLGVEMSMRVTSKCETDNATHLTLYINPADYGLMGLICKSVGYRINTSIVAGENEEQIWVKLGLGYEHHDGGRNGKDIATLWFTPDYKFISLRKDDGTVIEA